jgi:hypothetical protein
MRMIKFYLTNDKTLREKYKWILKLIDEVKKEDIRSVAKKMVNVLRWAHQLDL